MVKKIDKMKTIYFAGGCFWGVDKYFSLIKGVVSTESGYANGKTSSPSYQNVIAGSGHAEAVKVVYSPSIVTLNLLLEMFYEIIDPVSVNKQGNDVGIQYRSGVYYTDPEDEMLIRQSLEALQKKYTKPLAVEVKALDNFFSAEEYHQKYLDKNPGGHCHIGRSAFEKARKANE